MYDYGFELKRIADGLAAIAQALEHVATAQGYRKPPAKCDCGAGRGRHSTTKCAAGREYAEAHRLQYLADVDLRCTEWETDTW